MIRLIYHTLLAIPSPRPRIQRCLFCQLPFGGALRLCGGKSHQALIGPIISKQCLHRIVLIGWALVHFPKRKIRLGAPLFALVFSLSANLSSPSQDPTHPSYNLFISLFIDVPSINAWPCCWIAGSASSYPTFGFRY